MKRSTKSLHAWFGGLALLTAVVGSAGCEQNIKIDNPEENAGILGPKGILRGTATYIGPSPCIRDGQIEGALIILIFEAANPPPPDGLASTAVNFATVPGERLFANIGRPKTGPGSPGNKESLCASLDSPPVTAAANFSVQQLNAGRYQVRAFYSRQNRFSPLFNFANLPLAGDVFGGALVDPRAAVPAFASIDVGVPDAKNPNTLVIPPAGFVRENVAVTLLGPLRSNRPFFHVLYDKSRSFDVNTPVKTDLTTEAADQKAITGAEGAALGRIEFRQDHITTSQQNPFDATLSESCIGNPKPECDIFKFSQASFPQIRFKYGFPGDASNPSAGGLPDAWLAKNAKPREPFFADRIRPFYGIDPFEFADIPTSQKFALTRNFRPDGEPEIVRDNDTLESLAKIAEIFPSVVLSKLAEDDFGRVLEPPRSQTDPIVVIQTITLRDFIGPDGKSLGYGSMKATSEGAITGGALQKDGKRDETQALNKRGAIESVDEFTALIRPSVVCIYPQAELRGTLVTPAQKDPNPANPDATLVNRAKILILRANRVKDVRFGCLPPGTYSVNVVYPTGQAWSFPNVMGTCSYKLPPIGADAVPNEDCDQGKDQPLPKQVLDTLDFGKGFLKRPLLSSQTVWQTDASGKYKLDAAGRRIAQTVVIKPSDRCGHYETKPGVAVSIADVESGVVPKGTAKWVNNPVNEDTSLDTGETTSPFSANGVLDTGEDVNGNKQLDLKVPNACVYKYLDYVKLPDADKLK